jgi:molybdopterin converting factor subunit 1
MQQMGGEKNTMKTIQLEYFAVLRECAGNDREAVTTEAETPQQLFAELAARYDFPSLQSLKVAINDEFSDMSTALVDGDTVVFIPPVAGG